MLAGIFQGPYSSLTEKVVGQEEQERVGNRFRGIRDDANVEAIEAALSGVYLLSSISNRLIFLRVGRIGILAELSLGLEPSDYEGEWVCAYVRICCPC